ncbi:MAG: hypothetical protein AAGJ85_00220 [Pseudomonadota bacterium]
MQEARSKTIGLRAGLIILGLVAAIGLVSALRADSLAVQIPSEPKKVEATLSERLTDSPTQAYLARLRAVSPAGINTLETEAERRLRAGASNGELAELVLLSILVELKRGAGAFKQAPTEHYDRIIHHAEDALKRLEDEDSPWCEGPHLAAYLEQDDTELISSLIALYPYESEGYIWAMVFGTMALDAMEAGRASPVRRNRPSGFEKAWLQRTGLALGSDQIVLGLQIMAFSQSEGQGYQEMQTAIEGIDACKLGLAAVQVSNSLPEPIRATIWADLLPELFHGNMPYVIWRVNDYFYLD